jgi:hypothetical protein
MTAFVSTLGYIEYLVGYCVVDYMYVCVMLLFVIWCSTWSINK